MQIQSAKQLGFKAHMNSEKHDPELLALLTPAQLINYIDGVLEADAIKYQAIINSMIEEGVA